MDDSAINNSVVDSLLEKGYYLSTYQNSSLRCGFATAEVLKFFRSSIEEKLPLVSKDRARRGYSPINSENFATLVGEKKANDRVEKFRIGPEISEEKRESRKQYFSTKQSRVHFFPNDWSVADSNFRSAAIQIYESAELMMKSIAQTLVGEIFDTTFDAHTSILSLNYYESPQETGSGYRIAEHRDVSLFTIVASLTSDVHSNIRLQVYDISVEDWIDLDVRNGTFVVLCGEYLEYVSGGIFKAALHRVVQDVPSLDISACDRLSFAFFVSPNYDAEIDIRALDSAHSLAEPCLAYDDWRKWKISQAMKTKRN